MKTLALLLALVLAGHGFAASQDSRFQLSLNPVFESLTLENGAGTTATFTPGANSLAISAFGAGSVFFDTNDTVFISSLASLGDISIDAVGGDVAIAADNRLAFTLALLNDAAADASSAGQFQRNGAAVTYHDGTAVRRFVNAVRKNSAGTVFTRQRLNLIEGTGVTLTVADDSTDGEVDITVAASGSGSSGDTSRLNVNGDFSVAQDGTSFTVNGYTLDQWKLTEGTGATVTVSQQTHTVGQTDVPGEPTNFARFDRTVTGTVNSTFSSVIEDVRTGAGQVVTYSFYAKASAGTPTIQTDILQDFGAGGSADVISGLQTHVLSTSWQRFTRTLTLASISGKTIGTASYIELRFDVPTAAGTFQLELSDVQVEIASAATDFQRWRAGEELRRARRYFTVLGGIDSTQQRVGFGQCISTTQAAGYVVMPTPMRAAPTLSISAATDFAILNGTGAATELTALTLQVSSTTTPGFIATVAAGLTAGNATFLQADTTANARLKYDARL